MPVRRTLTSVLRPGILSALVLPLLAWGCQRAAPPAASASPTPAAAVQACGPRGDPRAGPGGDAAARRPGAVHRALQGRPRRHDQAAPHPRPHRPEPHPLLRGPGARGGDHLRGGQGLREAAQREARQQGRDGLRDRRSPCRATSSSPAAGSRPRATSRPPQLTITPERKKHVDFSDPLRDRHHGGARHRARRPAGGEPRRPVGQGGLRPPLEQLRRARPEPERALRERGQGRR